jgi:hypothetical protein
MYRSCAARLAACRNAKKNRVNRTEVFMMDWFLYRAEGVNLLHKKLHKLPLVLNHPKKANPNYSATFLMLVKN